MSNIISQFFNSSAGTSFVDDSDLLDLASNSVITNKTSNEKFKKIDTNVFNKTTIPPNLLPIGSYIQFAGSQPPDGFLVCNGGKISRTTYSALFAVIGTTYGSGDGSTTFNLPNLTDRFLQGSTTSGTVKDAGLPNITGYLSIDQNCITTSIWHGALHGTQGPGYDHVDGPYDYDSCSSIDFDASHSNSIYGNSTTVQPPALTCLICIKY